MEKSDNRDSVITVITSFYCMMISKWAPVGRYLPKQYVSIGDIFDTQKKVNAIRI